MDNWRRFLLMLALALLIILALGGLVWTNYQFAAKNPGGNDFLARWMGANYWVMKGISPYDAQVSLATQRMIYGRPADPARGEDIAHFVYPLYSMIFFAPLGPLEYLTARVVWMTLLEVSLFLLAIVSIRLVGWTVSPLKTGILVIFSLLWYHGVRTVIIGQFAGINALIITLALFLILKKQDFVAGLLLALSTSKPQMAFLLVPFVLFWALSEKRRDILGGTLLGFGILLVSSLALMPDWPLQWLRQLFEYPSYTSKIGSPLSVIANSMPGLSRSLNPFLHAVAAVYLLFEWVWAWRKNDRWFLWTALMTIVITNLVAYRTATTNYVMLLPALFLIFSVWEERWSRAGVVGVWLSIAALGAGLWYLFVLTVQGNEEQAIMYLPLPFFCLIGLWWVRWWSIHPPRVYIEDLAERVD